MPDQSVQNSTPLTTNQIVEGILEREGENGPDFLTPGDRGGRTSWGISERAHPEAWHNGPPSKDEARVIYFKTYVGPFLDVAPPDVRNQLVDFAVTSGVKTAIYYLQRTLGVTPDGYIGQKTRAALVGVDSRLLNNALVAARLKFIDTLTDTEKSQKQFEEGWESRALSFLTL